MTDIEDIVFGGNLDPSVVDQEVDRGVLSVAFGNDSSLLLVKCPVYSSWHAVEEVCDEAFVVGSRDHHGGRASVNDTEERIVLAGSVRIERGPSVAIAFRCITKGYTLAVCAVPVVVFKLD